MLALASLVGTWEQLSSVMLIAEVAHHADETKDAAYQQRTRMKLLADLLVSGIYREFAILVETLRQVAAVNFKSDWAESLLTIQLLSSFARHVSDELLGIPSKNIRSFISQTANEPDSGAIKQAGHTNHLC